MRGSQRSAVVALAALTTGLATACESPTPVQENFGHSFHAVTDGMVANPEAGQIDTSPLEGLDPITAETVIENWKYNQSQRGDERREILLLDTTE